MDVGLAPAGELNRQLIDNFFSRVLDLRCDPPARGMKPEQANSDLFGNQPCPVSPFDVQQFVSKDRILNVCRLATEMLGKRHNRSQHAERNRLFDLGSVANLRPCSERSLKFMRGF